MQRIIAQCYKELVKFKRDRISLALAFILPFTTLVIFGFAVRLEITNIPLFVQNLDNSLFSHTYTESLFSNKLFTQINTPTPKLSNPQKLIDEGTVQASIVIPSNFTNQVQSGLPSNIEVLVDATDVNNARIIKNRIQTITESFLQHQGLDKSKNQITSNIQLLSNPTRNETFFIIPGVYALILWIYPSLLASISMVREKEGGTILQVYASNIKSTEILIGKGLSFLLIGIIQALFVIGLGYVFWGLQLAGEPTSLIISTLIFLINSVMFGLLIGVSTDNLNSTIQGVSLLGFLTAFLLSGFIYPVSNIPFPLSLISNVIPSRYYIEITRDAFLRGNGWAGIGSSVVILTILAIVLFYMANTKLKRMQPFD
jgi:ABC-2 type transport system permease protein